VKQFHQGQKLFLQDSTEFIGARCYSKKLQGSRELFFHTIRPGAFYLRFCQCKSLPTVDVLPSVATRSS
jgi:hypothetical protein